MVCMKSGLARSFGGPGQLPQDHGLALVGRQSPAAVSGEGDTVTQASCPSKR